MAKAVGLDTGDFEVKLVELDGSFKRPRLVRFAVEPVPEAAPKGHEFARAINVAEAARAAFEDTRISKDGFTAAFPSREAVLRQIDVPFVGREQIRKVIKFEAEGSIHSHNVDDMVVDFMVLEEHKNESRVMIAAVPKPALRASFDALQRHGIEPEMVDLDAMALFRVGQWCGAFESDEAAAEAGDDRGEALVAAAVSPPARLLIDLGARSTRILVVANGKFIDMRTLRTGADAMADEVATLMGVGLEHAREAVEESLRTDEDFVIVGSEEVLGPIEGVEDEQEDDDGDSEPAAEEARTQLIPHSEVRAACDRYLSRMRRELVRFLTSVPAADNIEAVWVTGGASQTPGVLEVIADVFGCQPRPLDVLDNLSHKLDTDEARTVGPKLAVAIGLALDTLGGRRGFNFRQEDLSFTKGFDRIKFPLAIACMLALFLALVIALKSWRELRQMGIEYGATYSDEIKESGRGRKTREAAFLGYLGTLVNRESWFAAGQYFDKKSYDKLIEKLLATDTFKRLPTLKQELDKYYREQQQQTGYYADLRLGSGLGTLVQMAEVLKSVEQQLGRFLVTRVTLKLPYKEAGRRLTFELALRTDEASDFRTKWGVVERTFQEACRNPDSVFAAVRDESGEQATFEGAGGNGAMYRVSLDIFGDKSYPYFPPKVDQ